MYVIVGLGNPGRKYAGTRHNIGFRVIDALAHDNNIKVSRRKFKSLLGEGMIEENKVVLIKPQTYMNLSGKAVSEVVNFYKISHRNLILIYDDIDIPVGNIRIRKSGGPGTHNGMRSVVDSLGFTDFPRVRIGIGCADKNADIINHVIGQISDDDKQILDKAVIEAAKAIEDILKYDIDKAMNMHNTRHSGQDL